MSNKSNKNAGRDIIGRDQHLSASKGGVVVGGNVTGSNIITGNNNMIGVTNITNAFHEIYRKVEESSLTPEKKEDVKAEVQEVEEEIKKGDSANESFLRRRLNSIESMAPDILEVILTTFGNPAAGMGMVAKKIAERIQAERKSASA